MSLFYRCNQCKAEVELVDASVRVVPKGWVKAELEVSPGNGASGPKKTVHFCVECASRSSWALLLPETTYRET